MRVEDGEREVAALPPKVVGWFQMPSEHKIVGSFGFGADFKTRRRVGHICIKTKINNKKKKKKRRKKERRKKEKKMSKYEN